MQTCIPLCARLPIADQPELEWLIQVFLSEKHFEACGDLTLTDEMKIRIAGQACVLLLHRETDFFPTLQSVLIYPGKYYAPVRQRLMGGVVRESQKGMLGQAWKQGSMVLAWDAVRSGASDPLVGTNVVLHEFAHCLDYEDGWTNGVPLLTGPKINYKTRFENWVRVFEAEFKLLKAKAKAGDELHLDVYGAKNPAEFFAVATETFFEWPHQLAAKSPELYAELKGFFQQDPAQWTAQAVKPMTYRTCLQRGTARWENGNYEGALADFNQAITFAPDRAGPYYYRGSIKKVKGDLDGAAVDFSVAIKYEPTHAAAHLARGICRAALGNGESALADYDKSIELDPHYPDPYFSRGVIRESNGDRTGALSDFKMAIELNPEHAEARARLEALA